jgi:hypothetical protein
MPSKSSKFDRRLARVNGELCGGIMKQRFVMVVLFCSPVSSISVLSSAFQRRLFAAKQVTGRARI